MIFAAVILRIAIATAPILTESAEVRQVDGRVAGRVAELGHRLESHAAELGPVRDLARGEALEQHRHVVRDDVVPDEHVRVGVVELAD